MKKKTGSTRIRSADVPYSPNDKAGTDAFWKGATHHVGLPELRAKLGRPAKPPENRKEQIALRVDRDVLEWFRAQGTGWQTRMNAVLKAFRDASGS